MKFNPKWDERFLLQAAHVAAWSKDPSTKVGAVIVDEKRRVIGQGYNGFPRGVIDLPDRYADRTTKYRFVVHAEANAILNAGRSCEDCTIYVWPLPCCHECAKLVIQSGITKVVAVSGDVERWQESFDTAMQMFSEAGVAVDLVRPISP